MNSTEKPSEVPVDAAERHLMPSFSRTLVRHGLRLVRNQTITLQVNVGLQCNQTCKHCHLDAGPERTENMDNDTVNAVVAYARRARFQTADITGGAPELNPHLPTLITGLRPAVQELMLRCNLSALAETDFSDLPLLLRENRVTIVASLPAANAFQTDAQRGGGVFEKSIGMLRRLNEIGYGLPDSGLNLNIVSNPTGAFMPSNQEETENRFRNILSGKHNIFFNRLFVFGNAPLGRFRGWLKTSGNYDAYMEKLFSNFNPCAVDGLMCRSLVSVSWDGYLYDCDFNLAAGLPLGARKIHVSQIPDVPEEGMAIMIGEHCYTCTVGKGFT